MTEWSVKISDETDKALKAFLAEQHGKACDLSTFVEDAVKDRLFTETVRKVKEQNAQYDPREITETIEEAVGWARGHRWCRVRSAHI